ncbi:MAG: ABC transporter, partial [Anaerolineae bacterium]|nr:ABC transporter [Anaerolineae bacterium]
EKAKAALAHLDGKAALQVVHDTLTVRALKAAGLLPGVLDALAAAGIEIGEVRLRENTLEDVFIQLTGRRLRE